MEGSALAAPQLRPADRSPGAPLSSLLVRLLDLSMLDILLVTLMVHLAILFCLASYSIITHDAVQACVPLQRPDSCSALLITGCASAQASAPWSVRFASYAVISSCSSHRLPAVLYLHA